MKNDGKQENQLEDRKGETKGKKGINEENVISTSRVLYQVYVEKHKFQIVISINSWIS